MRWKRNGTGRQVSADGRYAVQSDGYLRGTLRFPGDPTDYGQGGEWAAILVATDENLDWFPTMRAAKARCEAHASSATSDA